MSVQRIMYKLLALSNDAKAVRRGPKAVARRVGRRAYGRASSRLARKIFG